MIVANLEERHGLESAVARSVEAVVLHIHGPLPGLDGSFAPSPLHASQADGVDQLLTTESRPASFGDDLGLVESREWPMHKTPQHHYLPAPGSQPPASRFRCFPGCAR